MASFKRNPIRSFARKQIIKAIGDQELVNKKEIAKITHLSPLTVSSILREFRNYKLVICHIGGLYSLSGDGEHYYLKLKDDTKFKSKLYDHRLEIEEEKEDNEFEDREEQYTIYED
jgi:transcription initiation factor IIE alpha subunit